MKNLCIEKLPLYYWVSVIETGAVMAIMHFVNDSKSLSEGIPQEANLAFTTVAILFMLICVPVIMKFYHTQTTERIPKEMNEKKLENRLSCLFLVREIVVLMALILNYTAYELFNSSTNIYCVFICLIMLLFFCFPNKEDLKYRLSNMVKISNQSEQQ